MIILFLLNLVTLRMVILRIFFISLFGEVCYFCINLKIKNEVSLFYSSVVVQF